MDRPTRLDTAAADSAQADLRTQAREQAAVAELGLRALALPDLRAVMTDTVDLVARTLDVELCKVLQLLPNRAELLLVAGVGWREGLVGRATVGAGRDSQAGYTLLSKEPVLVEDLRTESRFSGPSLLREHGVISGVSVVIHGASGPWGVLGAHTARRRAFSSDDVNFLRSVANVLAAAIQRFALEGRLLDDRFRGLLEAAPDAIVTVGTDGRISLVNSQAERMFGYSREELVGQEVEMLLPEALRERHWWHRDGYFAAPSTRPMGIGMELWGRRRGGELFPVEISLSPLQTPDGMLATAVIRDVTERKRAEAALRQAEERFRSLLETAPDAIVSVSRDGRIALINTQAEQLFGYPREELLGQPVEVLLPERLREMHARHRWDYSRNPHTRPMGVGLELSGRRKDGTQFPVEISLSPVDTDGETLVTAVIRDVTERKRSEERLRFLSESSKLLTSSLDYETTLQVVARLAVPGLADACAVDVLDGERTLHRVAVAHADLATEELLRETVGSHPVDPDSPHPLMRVITTGEPQFHAEVPESLYEAASRNPGRLTTIQRLNPKSYMCVPLSAGGRTLGALSFFSGERGGYDEADLALAEELARRAAVAVDNARLYRETREAVQLRDNVLAVVTHDLRNPLQAVKLYTEVARLNSQSPAPRSEKVADALSMIDQSVSQMTAQLGELLDVARLQAGQPLELDRHPTGLVPLARRISEEYQRTSTKHEIRLEASEPSLVGEWDPVRTGRVLANLLSNAIKYSPGGGLITVTLRCEERADGSWAVVEVRDRGLGIPEADLPRVFERFHRAANVVGRVRGTGLGLSSARQIVEQHGGSLTVASREAEGSTFTVRLPIRGR